MSSNQEKICLLGKVKVNINFGATYQPAKDANTWRIFHPQPCPKGEQREQLPSLQLSVHTKKEKKMN